MITRTIGSGAQHPDVADWVAWVQANAVVAGNLTDDVTGAIVAAGCTVSTAQAVSGWAPGLLGYSTTLAANAGDAFNDNVNVRTNALIYNASNGAFFASSYNGGGNSLEFQVNKFRVIDLQIKSTGGYVLTLGTSTVSIDDFLIDKCILEGPNVAGGVVSLHSGVDGANTIIQSSLIRNGRGASGSSCVAIGGSGSNALKLYDNQLVTAGGTDVVTGGSYGKLDAQGNVVPFVYTYAFNIRDANCTGSSNATASSNWPTSYGGGTLSGLTSSQFNIIIANEFVDASTPSDFRLKSGGTQLQGTGTTISGITTDISGFTRSAGFEDIGCWQITAGSSNPTVSIGGVASTKLVSASAIVLAGLGSTRLVSAFKLSAAGNGATNLASAATVTLSGRGAPNLVSAATLAALGQGTANFLPAGFYSFTIGGVASTNLLAAAVLSASGAVAANLVSAALLRASGAASVSAVMAARLAAVGAGTAVFTPGVSFPGFGIGGLASVALKSASALNVLGHGTFTPVPVFPATPFFMSGQGSTNFSGVTSFNGWIKQPGSAPGWTVQPKPSMTWTKQS